MRLPDAAASLLYFNQYQHGKVSKIKISETFYIISQKQDITPEFIGHGQYPILHRKYKV